MIKISSRYQNLALIDKKFSCYEHALVTLHSSKFKKALPCLYLIKEIMQVITGQRK